MQIGDANQAPSTGLTGRADGVNLRSNDDASQSSEARQAPKTSAAAGADSDRVSISPAAMRALQKDAGTGDDGELADSADGADEPSTAKSFLYGCFRLDRPQPESQSKPTDSYEYGRWIATAVTVGALISVFA